MKGVDAMARSQNEEAQQVTETASQTVLSRVIGKTTQLATTLSNKIYDISLYTGIKLVRYGKAAEKVLFLSLCKI